MTTRLADRRLYIFDLLMHLSDMGQRRRPLDALLYRRLARQLRQALAGLPDAALVGRFGPYEPMLAEALEDRHFDQHGLLRGSGAFHCQARAKLWWRLLGVAVADRPGEARSGPRAEVGGDVQGGGQPDVPRDVRRGAGGDARRPGRSRH